MSARARIAGGGNNRNKRPGRLKLDGYARCIEFGSASGPLTAA
jgi:hypothetical protein